MDPFAPADLPADTRHSIIGLVTSGATGAGLPLLQSLPALRAISVNGLGTDRLDTELCKERKISIATTRGVLEQDVADLAMALLLAVARRLVEADGYVRRGEWNERSFPLAQRVSSRRCGIFGLGTIGRAIAGRAQAFGMSIGYITRSSIAQDEWQRFTDLHSLATWADTLILAAPLTRDTHGAVDSQVLRALGEEGILVNVARGGLVVEEDLIAALHNRTILGAGLDVFESEPRIDSRFASLPNTVLAPHVGSATHQTRAVMRDLTVQQLVRALDD
jgi:hydroxypyruvate reductase